MSNDLLELIEKLQKDNPALLEGLEKAAAAGLAQDKIALYNLLVKENKNFTYDALNKVLVRHENSRLDINWNSSDYIYRIVVSRRKRQPEKEKKGGDTNVPKPPIETKGTVNQ